jgi:hypothetical protein
MAEPGRPSIYTDAVAEEICSRLAAGESLNKICKDSHLPTETCVRHWALDDREGFYSKYARAREIQALRWAEEIIEISDDSSGDVEFDKDGKPHFSNEFAARSKLRVDTRKWILSKVLPKVYGDRTVLAGDKDAPLGVQLIHSIPQPDRGEK